MSGCSQTKRAACTKMVMVSGLHLSSAFLAPGAAAIQGNAHPVESNLGLSVLSKDTTDWEGAGFEPPTLRLLNNLLYLPS